MDVHGKRYGLIIPQKHKGAVLQKPVGNVFGDDSDEESSKPQSNSSLQLKINQTKMKKQTQMEIDKALLEDPNVYEYDSIYDNIVASKSAASSKNSTQAKEKKPRYITGLLKAAEIRKREDEKRMERKVQKEREEEGDKYEDKEAFVTSAYKKKMQEMKEQEEQEKRVAAMEEMLDVTKQKDMSGFYRYLYRETTGSLDVKEPHPDEVDSNAEKKPAAVKEERSEHSSSSDSDSNLRSPLHKKSLLSSQHKQDKRRVHSSSREREIAAKTRRSRSPEMSSRLSGDKRRSRSSEKEKNSRSIDKRKRSRSTERRKRSRSTERRRSRSIERRKTSGSTERRKRSRSTERRKRSRSKERSKWSQSLEKGRSLSRERKSRDRGKTSSSRNESGSAEKMKYRSKSRDRKSSEVTNTDKNGDRSLDGIPQPNAILKDGKDTNTESSVVGTDNHLNSEHADDDKSSDKKPEVDLKTKYARRATDSDVEEARKRYLARRLEKLKAKPAE